jgi:3-phenylpropionate/trans-cinnamate dioxygenase ferredoxin subunit
MNALPRGFRQEGLVKPVMPMNALADGEMTVRRVDGVEVLICRVDGRFYALANRCSHAGQALHGGRLHGWQLGCPLHGAAFDVRDGRCLRAPAEVGLVTYPVQIEQGRVQVDVSRPRPPGR